LTNCKMSLQIEAAATLEGHTDRAWSLAWHPTQPLIASCSGDKSVRLAIFRLNNSNSISFLRPASTALPLTHTRTVRNLAWNPVTGTLASASFDSTVGLWESMSEQGIDDGDPAQSTLDLESWDCVSSLEGHESEVKAVAWNHDGRMLATCGRDKSVWIWEFDSDSGEFECLAVLMDHTQDVKSVVWHPKEGALALA
jgi:WD40 repeat protein